MRLSGMEPERESAHPDNDIELYDEKHERRPSAIAIILDCRTDDSGHELQ